LVELKIENDKFIFSGKSNNITEEKNKLLAPFNKKILNYALKTEVLLNKSQQIQVNKTIGCKRFVKNAYLDIQKDMYNKSGLHFKKKILKLFV
jgi:hypothetical protein